ncbi:MAG: arginine decarboxylase [Paludibacteraceae bacterium]|nr:arginine decarboxylase [Candidatus Colousia faecequi]MCQ2338188.1 arginine decarboxylase [Paludibacteraceae bacterium]
MKNKYIDLIQQAFEMPNEEFTMTEDGELEWFGIPLMDIIKQYGTPLRICYLPKIADNIRRVRRMFNVAIAKTEYDADYNYCYCTKSSHFEFVMNEVLKNNVNIETSSAFDINILESLFEAGTLKPETYIICNGFKRPQYIENIQNLMEKGFTNIIPILDNKFELDLFDFERIGKMNVGIRIASEEEPKFEFYTSRLGIRYNDIIPYYKQTIAGNPHVSLKMLHFFVNTGIRDTAYYWNELSKAVNLYCDLRKICPELDSLNIGGGMPIQAHLDFEFDYEYMIEEIVTQIKKICDNNNVPVPRIFTEFGSYTVGESGAMLYSIVNQKQQNDREKWNMIDSSFMTTLPDTWGINQRYVFLAINNWNSEYERVNLGGLTCDSEDFYNAEAHSNAIFMPKISRGEEQYIGFFHMGAYQESLGGYGGIQHCLIPGPKLVVIDKDENGEYFTKLFAKEQSYKSMLKILGY